NNPNQMTRLINVICNNGKIPKKLLISKMTSIPKKINAMKCDDLRGIRIKSSLLSIIDKLVLNRIWPILEKTIHKEQNGFMKGRGTDDNIVILRIILYNRKYITKKNCIFTLIDINKAFGQGYSLSGPLFNLYLNDIITEIKNKTNINQKIYDISISPCLLYADDIITFTEYPNDNNKVLSTIQEYCTKWKLKINTNKCIISSIKKTDDILLKGNTFKINKISKTIKYLGITFNTATLSWMKHVEDTIAKANTIIIQSQIMGIIGGKLEIKTQIKYYKAIIRPVIEYGFRSILFRKSLITRLSALQHLTITRILKVYRSTFSPATRLIAGIPSLEARNKHLLITNWFNLFKNNHLSGELIKQEYNYIMNNIHTYIEKIRTKKKIPPAINVEVLKAMIDNDMLCYWYFPPTYMTSQEWSKLVKKRIYKNDYIKDIKEIETKIANQPLVQVIKECNPDMTPGKPLKMEIIKEQMMMK
ncbi:hypothetical protein RFI_29380, partial [Reticulomyxa filosa]